MSIQTAGLEAAFDIRCFVIPADTFDSWNALSQQLISLTQAELQIAPHSSVYLCGESFGGCLALNVLLQAPNLFDRIILINSASSFHRVPLLNLGSLILPWTPQFVYDFSSILALPFLAQIARLSPTARQALMQASQDAPKKTAEQRLVLLREFKVDEIALQQVTQPVLVIASQRDCLLPSVHEAQRLANMFPNSQIITLPDSGHACLVEVDVNLYTLLQTHNFLEICN